MTVDTASQVTSNKPVRDENPVLKSQLKKMIFFTIAWQMLVCDLLCVFVEVILVIPESLAGRELYPKFVVNLIGFIESLGFRAYLFFAFFLTLNRLAIFVFPKLNYLIFGRENIFRW
uniref:Uncharacterized protein n=1 Tax=Ditylenchus dipsaci TaxID=166011 RepID=A0A915DAI5_9BILA